MSNKGPASAVAKPMADRPAGRGPQEAVFPKPKAESLIPPWVLDQTAAVRKLRHFSSGTIARAMIASWLTTKAMSHQKAASMKP